MLPAVILFLAGFAGLVAEVVWARWFATVYGGTAPAAAAVLSAYLGGLALGGLWLGRSADRSESPRRLAGWLQLGAGLATVSLLAVPALLPRLYGAALAVSASPAWVGALRFALAALFLLAPAILMGGTLPAAVRWLREGREGSAAPSAGRLRAASCLGAALGALVAVGWIIPVLGLSGATLSAAAASFLAGALALAGGGRSEELSAAEAAARAAEILSGRGPAQGGGRAGKPGAAGIPAGWRIPAWAAVLLAALAGAVTLSAELAHMRAAAFFTNSTLRTFAAVSAVYIAGLGLGSAAGAYLARRVGRGGAPAALAAVLAVAAAALGQSVLMLDGWKPGVGVFWRSVICCGPAAVALGAAFPLLVAALDASAGRVGRAVGAASAALEAGSAAGPVLGALVLLPSLGTEVTLLAAAAAAVLAAVALVFRAGRSTVRPDLAVRILVIAALPCAALPVLGVGLYGRAVLRSVEKELNPDPLQGVQGRRRKAEPVKEGGVKPRLESLEEGPEAVVSVVSVWQEEEGREVRSLYIGRKMQADDSTPWLRLEKQMGALPALLCPAASGRSFHVGLGSGVTAAWSAAAAPGRAAQVAEIVPGVAGKLGEFRPHNAAGRFEVRLGDGRAMLAAEPGRFELVVTDIVFPEDAGAGALFSVDYFRLVRSRLAEGGLFAHWLPLWQLSPEALRSTVRAFLNVFPDGTLWAASLNPDRPLVALVGLNGAPEAAFDPAALGRRLVAAGGSGGRLAGLDLDRPEAVLARFVAGPARLEEIAAGARPSTDDLPLTELAGAGREGAYHGPENLVAVHLAWEPLGAFTLPGSKSWGREVFDRAAELQNARRLLAESNLALAGTRKPWTLERVQPALEGLRQARGAAPRDPEIAHELWSLLASVGEWAYHAHNAVEARALLKEALSVGPERDYILRELGMVTAVLGQPREGLDHARRACALDPREPANFEVLEQVANSAGEKDEASRAAARAKELRQGRQSGR